MSLYTSGPTSLEPKIQKKTCMLLLRDLIFKVTSESGSTSRSRVSSFHFLSSHLWSLSSPTTYLARVRPLLHLNHLTYRRRPWAPARATQGGQAPVSRQLRVIGLGGQGTSWWQRNSSCWRLQSSGSFAKPTLLGRGSSCTSYMHWKVYNFLDQVQ